MADRETDLLIIGAGVVGSRVDRHRIDVERDHRRSCSRCRQRQYATASPNVGNVFTFKIDRGKKPREELAGQKQLGMKHGRINGEAKACRPHGSRRAPVEYEFVR